MKRALLDTDTASFFLRGDSKVVTKAAEYLDEYDALGLSIITYYELKSGLQFRDARKQLANFEILAGESIIYPMTATSSNISAEWYAKLRKEGNPIDDIDLLIAGIAIANNLILVTNNEKHFKRIKELEIENWKK